MAQRRRAHFDCSFTAAIRIRATLAPATHFAPYDSAFGIYCGKLHRHTTCTRYEMGRDILQLKSSIRSAVGLFHSNGNSRHIEPMIVNRWESTGYHIQKQCS